MSFQYNQLPLRLSTYRVGANSRVDVGLFTDENKSAYIRRNQILINPSGSIEVSQAAVAPYIRARYDNGLVVETNLNPEDLRFEVISSQQGKVQLGPEVKELNGSTVFTRDEGELISGGEFSKTYDFKASSYEETIQRLVVIVSLGQLQADGVVCEFDQGNVLDISELTSEDVSGTMTIQAPALINAEVEVLDL